MPGGKGRWRVFTGNEIGALLCAWLWRRHRELHPLTPPPTQLVLASTVSSKFLKGMAAVEGFRYQETLTGFKWMGNAMESCQASGGNPLFAFEEAIGFACWSGVRDKDGVVGGAVFAEMAGVLASEGVTLGSKLESLYTRYGASVCNNGYVFVEDPLVTIAIFERLIAEGRYWGKCGRLAIVGIRDLKSPGWDSASLGGSPTLATSSSSNMLTYTFSNGVTATLRSSGTEPKLKWYTEGPSADAVDTTVACILDEMIQPEKWGIKRPPPCVRWHWD